MLTIFEKLLQRIESVDKFLSSRIKQEPHFLPIQEEIKELIKQIEISKLRVKLVSRFPLLSSSFQTWINTQTQLNDKYIFSNEPFPVFTNSRTKIEVLASLILQPSVIAEGKNYQLPTNQKTSLGYRSDCQIPISREYNLVSGYHAEIIPPINPQEEWQIYDLNSRHGTYINGQRITAQVLKPEDKITLGYSKHSLKSPELVFQSESRQKFDSPQINHLEGFLSDCDILILIINATQEINDQEKELIKKACESQLFKIFIVIDDSSFDVNIADFKNNLNHLEYIDNFIIKTLTFDVFYPNVIKKITAEINSKFEDFHELLFYTNETLIKDYFKTKFMVQCNLIESILNQQEDACKKEIQKIEAQLNNRTPSDLKEKLNRVLHQANIDKNQTFQHIRMFDFSQSKFYIMDGTSTHSFIYKIKEFIDGLKPVVVENKTKKRQYEIILSSEKIKESETIHTYITRLSTQELAQWAKEEWQKIHNQYANGGLDELTKRTYLALKIIPSLEITNFPLNDSLENFDIYKCFQETYAQITDKIIREENSYKGDIIRIGVTGLIFLAAPNPIPLVMGIVNYFDRNAMQKKAQDSRTEQQIEALKIRLYNHYHAISRSMIEKLCQHLNLELQYQENKINEYLKTINQQTVNYINNLTEDMNQQQIQLQLLKKYKTEFIQRLQGSIN